MITTHPTIFRLLKCHYISVVHGGALDITSKDVRLLALIGISLRVEVVWVLWRIFGPKRGEVTGEWRKPHNEELNDLYCSPNIFRDIKSRRMRWAGHVARMGERSGVYRILVGKL
jgi:hypothetical protein